ARMLSPGIQKRAVQPVFAQPVTAPSGQLRVLPDREAEPPVAMAATPFIRTVAELGVILKAARKRMRMSQQVFADYAGVGRRFVSELENGKESLEIGKVLACARSAGVDIAAKPRSGG
ncbi:MAG: hypothetical protein RL367_1231, partial [Pseudomonadota bacterium]